MAALRLALTALLAACASVVALAQTTAQPEQTTEPSQGSSSSQTHRKKAPATPKTHRVQVPAEDSPAPELTRAEELIQKQDYAAAEPLLQTVVKSDASNYVAWFDLGFVQNRLGKVDDSIAAYRKSVAAKPDVFEANLNLGLQLAKTGQPDAEQFLAAATKLKPTSHIDEGRARAWLSLGQVLEKTKPVEAVDAYRKAAALQPKDPEPHLSAGLLLEKQNQFADAENEYKQALALGDSADATMGLANIYMRGRRFPEAAEYLRKLVVANPDQAAPHIQLGRVLAAEGKNEEAIAELEAGAKLAPHDLDVQRDLAELYVKAGKNDLAEGAYRRLVERHPQDADLRHKLGQSFLREKKFMEAQQEFLAAIRLKPDFGEAYGDLAFSASENKEYALTLKALDTRAKTLPENASTYFLRASALDHLRQFKDAAANYHLFLNAANGKYPDQEWQAKHRLIAIERNK